MGGSQREENYDKLVARMQELNMDPKEMDWYLNLRKYGGCVHSGFGMGFERLLIYLTGVDNIRDVIIDEHESADYKWIDALELKDLAFGIGLSKVLKLLNIQ